MGGGTSRADSGMWDVDRDFRRGGVDIRVAGSRGRLMRHGVTCDWAAPPDQAAIFRAASSADQVRAGNGVIPCIPQCLGDVRQVRQSAQGFQHSARSPPVQGNHLF